MSIFCGVLLLIGTSLLVAYNVKEYIEKKAIKRERIRKKIETYVFITQTTLK